MSDEPPPNRKGKRGVRQSLRTGFQRLKDAVSPSSSCPAAGQSGFLSASSSRLTTSSFSRPTTPALMPASVTPEANQQVVSQPLVPVSEDPVNSTNVSTTADDGAHGSVVWNRLASSLHSLEGATGLFPPLKSAVGALIGSLDIVRAATSNRKDYEQLLKEVEEFQSMIAILSQHAGVFNSESNSGSIAYIAQCIESQVADIQQKGVRGSIGRLLDATQDQEDIVQRYRHVDRLFRQLQCDLTVRTNDTVETHLETTLLRGMSPVDDARYNSSYSTTIKRRACTSETREAIHQALQDWTTNLKNEKIYWMNGMAGTGKTTIAYSYCEWLKSTHRLGASFFCSRISSTCRSLSRIVPTIAYQLARYSPAFRSKVCAVLKDNPDAGTLNVMQQFEDLISQPMMSCKGAIPDGVVVVIDALDECDDIYSVRLLLDVLLKFADRLPVKFFVSSRPEHVIRDRMVSQGGPARAIVHLHDIEQSIVEEDIKKYLTESFSVMSPAPTPEQVTILAKRSRNLFIYAATVVRYIHPEAIRVDSIGRLKSMLQAISDPKAAGKNKYEDLDRLYTTVLSAVFGAPLDDGERESMQHVLWTVVCAKEPMTVETIASLASLEYPQVWASLECLRSVVHVPENNTLISTLHASFPEYMLDKSRSGDFYCSEPQSHERLVHRLFGVMQLELRFNICDLKNSFLTDDQVEDLETRVTECISPTLSYACRYWGAHLLFAPAAVSTSERVVDFLSSRLLFWMEVLSLSRSIGTGAPMMQQVQTWFRQLVDTPDEIQKWLSDARNFLTWFAANPCSRSTPHIYISALPLCAKSNWVYQHYSQRMQGLVNVAIGQRDETVLAIWRLGSRAISAAISPDGERIAAGSLDGNVQVYDIETGAIVAGPFKGHTDRVMSVAFSADGTLIASGAQDKTVIIWDAHTCRIATGPLHEHIDNVWCVAFSPNGRYIASGSSQGCLIVWDRHSGNTIILERRAHSDYIYCVTFSLDSLLLASCSGDRTIRLWDTASRAPINQQLLGHEGIVYKVAFSPDGGQLVSGSADGTIRVWDVPGGAIVGQPIKTHQILSLDLSPDGTKAVSGGLSANPDIMVWDLQTRSTIGLPLHGHTHDVRSVMFTPDETRIVSCSHDSTIRIWDVQTANRAADEQTTREASNGSVAFSPDRSRFVSSSSTRTLQTWEMQPGAPGSCSFDGQADVGPIQSVAYSPQGTHVAACTDDCTIRLWNALTGAMVSPPMLGHKAAATCLTFSPDGAYICSGSDDSTIIVWDILSATMAGQPYEGHTDSVRSVIYSHNGTHIASGSVDNTVRIWEPSTGTLVRTLSGHKDSVESVAFSLDGRYTVSGSADGSIRRWDVRAASDPVEYRCSDAVSSIAYSPDGGRVIAGFGSTIQIFNDQITEVLCELSLPRNEMVRWVEFSPDGNHICSVSVSKDEKKNSGSKQAGETAAQQLPQNEPANIIRVWRPDIRADEGGSSTTSDDSSTAPGDSSMTSGNWSYKPDGRILSPDGLVIWVSPDLIPYLKQYAVSDRSPYVWSSEGVIDLGYQDLCIGERWTECYIRKG